MELITALLKTINKDNWQIILLSSIIILLVGYILANFTKKPLEFKIGPINIKLGNGCEDPKVVLAEQAETQSEKVKVPQQAIIVDRVRNFVVNKEKQLTKLYLDIMIRQMNFCDEKIVEMKGLFIEEYSRLLSKKLEKTEDVRVHSQFKNYKMFLTLMMEYAVKDSTFKKSVRQNHLAEFTIDSWDAFVEQKVNITLELIKEEYDFNYPDDSLVSRKEVDESNERVFEKIRPMIISMYRKAREISIESRAKIKFIEEEMYQYLKGDISDSGNLSEVD